MSDDEIEELRKANKRVAPAKLTVDALLAELESLRVERDRLICERDYLGPEVERLLEANARLDAVCTLCCTCAAIRAHGAELVRAAIAVADAEDAYLSSKEADHTGGCNGRCAALDRNREDALAAYRALKDNGGG